MEGVQYSVPETPHALQYCQHPTQSSTDKILQGWSGVQTRLNSRVNRQTLKTWHNQDFINQTLTGEICKTDSETKTALIYQSMLFHADIFKPKPQSKTTQLRFIVMGLCGMYRQGTTVRGGICGNHSSNWQMRADSTNCRNKVNHHAKQSKDNH